MICKSCNSEFSDQHSNGVRLTIVCDQCATSSDLVTKTTALQMGATLADLNSIHCMYKRNPHYRSASDMQLFVREEIDVLATIATAKKRRLKEEATRKKQESDARQQRVKRSRIESLAKRTQSLGGIVPTPGLVCGDFLSVHTKNPAVGTRSLLRRKAIWSRLATTEIPVAVQIFEWAVRNKQTDVTPAGALEEIRHEKHLFGRVAVVEGHRVLSFLDEVDRLTLLSLNPVFQETLYALPVRNISGELSKICDTVSRRLDLPFSTVLKKIDESENCWISKYLYVINPERVASIMAPHFLGGARKQKMLKNDMDESFTRWGMCPTDSCGRVDFFVNYFRGGIVDVEFYSASCYMLKAGVAYYPKGADVVTSHVMSTPGVTWMEATKKYVGEQLAIRHEELVRAQLRAREMQEAHRMRKEDKTGYCRSIFICACGNPSAQQCPFDLCGACCVGPCARHRRH